MKAQLSMLLVIVAAGSAMAAPSPSVRVSEVREMSLSEPVIVGGEIRARSDIVLPAMLEGELDWVAARDAEKAKTRLFSSEF